MNIDRAVQMINMARKEWLLHEGSQREERYIASVRAILLEYGEGRWVAADLSEARRVHAVQRREFDAISCKLPVNLPDGR